MSFSGKANPNKAGAPKRGPAPKISSPDKPQAASMLVVGKKSAPPPVLPRAVADKQPSPPPAGKTSKANPAPVKDPAKGKATTPPPSSESGKPVIPLAKSPLKEANNGSQSHSSTPVESNEKETEEDLIKKETEEDLIKKETEEDLIKKETEEELIEKPTFDNCTICLDECTEPKQLDKCGHTFCTPCIDHYFNAVKPQCPCCFTIYGELRGNQPEGGKMDITKTGRRLPGFGRTSTDTIKITYSFANGIQDENHPNPGMPYHGTVREAYLPDNPEGRHVLELLQTAFDRLQVFTVGQSRTTGQDNVVTWNDIHHKTSPTGGMQNFGYPDETYLNRVQQELAAKGVV